VASLKSLIPAFASQFDMKPAAIYERQRALVRGGLLQMRPGHGPGSGVLATPESVAMLLISLVATANLSEVERQTKVAANLKSRKKRCPLTNQRTFAHALADVLRYEVLAKRTSFVYVERGGPDLDAAIAYFNYPLPTTSEEFDSMTASRSAFGKGRAREHQLFSTNYLALPFADFAAWLRENYP
jgi:hypothetical protein